MIWHGALLDLKPRTALDTLRLGVGGCGDLSAVGALLLELCGVRTRLVAGFNPSVRAKIHSGGHTAYEFFDRDRGRWCYFDPFSDLLLPVSVAELADSPLGQTVVSWLPRSVFADFTLAELFAYHIYGDRIGRLPRAGFLELEDEAAYGFDWELATPDLFIGDLCVDDLAPLPQTLHVRCRYLFGHDVAVGHFMSEEILRRQRKPAVRSNDLARAAKLSPWECRRIDVTYL